ncbi:MAG: amino acid permease [Cyanobacteria bacterium SZAS LIN-3]|nr:amino acid permease [Cyanobacteria bacterium SZAS LIN-3]
MTTSDVEATHIGSEMKVGISAFGSWMLGVGSIIGSMAWLMHAPMLARAGPAACMTAWLIAGTLSLPLALILMELASMFPTAGGPYVYKYYALKRLVPGMGEMLGFLTGWLLWIAILVGIACMSNGLTNMLAGIIWGSAQASPIWFGPVLITTLFGVTTALNFLSIADATKAGIVFSIMKIGMAAGFALLVFSSGHWSLANALTTVSPAGCKDFGTNVTSVLMLALAGFSFLEVSGCTSSETDHAQQSVPRAVFLTLLSITAIYIAMCFCISISSPFTLSADKSTLVVPGTAIQATCPAVAGLVGGTVFGSIFTGCVIASIVGCGFTVLLAIARISYSMAETKLFPAQFAHLDAKTGVPTYSLWFQFWCVTILGIAANLAARSGFFPDAYAFLGDTFGFMYAFVAVLYGVCVVSLRYTDPDMERPFRVGRSGNVLVWIMALITIGIWGYAALGCVQWAAQLTGVVITLSGVPIYYYYKRTSH